jgi:hypothetical protein
VCLKGHTRFFLISFLAASGDDKELQKEQKDIFQSNRYKLENHLSTFNPIFWLPDFQDSLLIYFSLAPPAYLGL